MASKVDLFNPRNLANLNATICLETFDEKKKNQLNFQDFTQLCKFLFRNADGAEYDLDNCKIKEIFTIFDKNKDGFIDTNEFRYCWDKWIRVILQPKSALLIIDVQNDFISGTLNISNGPAKQNGADVIAPINALLDTVTFNSVVYSLDWHPKNHISFIDNINLREVDPSSPVKQAEAKVFDEVVFRDAPKMTQKLWPVHCLQDCWGSQLHDDLTVLPNATKVYKGMDPEIDSYSAFYNNDRTSQTILQELLHKACVTDVYVCGLAWDYCVGYTALHSLELGYRTILVADCTRALDLCQADNIRTQINANNGIIVDSARVDAMVHGLDRLPELGYKLAKSLKNDNPNK